MSLKQYIKVRKRPSGKEEEIEYRVSKSIEDYTLSASEFIWDSDSGLASVAITELNVGDTILGFWYKNSIPGAVPSTLYVTSTDSLPVEAGNADVTLDGKELSYEGEFALQTVSALPMIVTRIGVSGASVFLVLDVEPTEGEVIIHLWILRKV